MAAGPTGAGPAGAGLAWAGPGLKQQALDLLIRANLVHRELRDHDRSGSVIEVLRPLPPLAFIPLFIIWLGIGEAPKEVLIMIGVIPIMAVTTVAALDEVPGDLRLCARTLGASPRCTLLRMQIRSALPGILTGMRISMAGRLDQHRRRRADRGYDRALVPDHAGGRLPEHGLVFSGIITIALLGLILDACLRGLLLVADPSRRR